MEELDTTIKGMLVGLALSDAHVGRSDATHLLL